MFLLRIICSENNSMYIIIIMGPLMVSTPTLVTTDLEHELAAAYVEKKKQDKIIRLIVG